MSTQKLSQDPFRPLAHRRPFWILGSRKFCRNFQEGPGGQISFKWSQEPKTSEKKYFQEVGHGSLEYDLTTYITGTSQVLHISDFGGYHFFEGNLYK